MKNINIKVGGFCLLFLLIISFFSVQKVWAMILAPYFDISIVVNSDSGDMEFNYDLKTYSPDNPIANNEQSFPLLTASGTINYNTSLTVGDSDTVYLTQANLSGWKLSDVTCTSTNPEIIFESYSSDNSKGIKILATPYSSISCVFNNSKIKNPVIIIPGVLSSYLNKNDDDKTELWPNIFEAIFGLPGDRYLDELALNEIGQTKSTIIPTDIFRKIGKNDFFDGLVKKLEQNEYEENKNLFVFPYDWRLDIREIKLKEKIDEILFKTGAERVDIIAHSMGGLVTKYYIEQNKENSKIDKFIDIATPHLGAPSAIKTLLFGDDMGIKFGFLGLNALEVKKIAQNMPSIYQLLPSENYFSTTSLDYKYYLYDMDDVDKDGVRGRLSYEQTKQFLKNTGRNEVLLNNAPNIHNNLDFLNPSDYGIKTYNIVGCGMPTIGKLFTLGQSYNGEYYDVGYISGDGTVPEKSARSFPSIEEYEVTGVNHASLPSKEGTRELIFSLLTDKVSDYDFTTYEYVSTSTPLCKLPDGELLSFHGPVKVDIYDKNQNHTGPILGSGYESGISEISYDFIDNNTFVFLPLVNQYQVTVTPTSNHRGHSSAHIRRFESGQVTNTTYFNDIPLANASTTVTVNINNSEPQIIVDENGDGTETQIIPSSTIIGDSLDDTDPPITNIEIISLATSTSINIISSSTDILITEYSIDDGETYQTATSSIIITEVGTTTIIFQSTDTAGNIENPQRVEIYIPEPVIIEEVELEIIEETNHSSGRGHNNRVVEREVVAEDSVMVSVVAVATSTLASSTEVLVIASEEKKQGEEVEPAEFTNKEPLYYASVVTAESGDSLIYWLILILIILILLLIIISRKMTKKVKYNYEKR
jgi:hypothetical protein